MGNTKIYEKLIIQHLTGKLNEKDEVILKNWLKESKTNMKYFLQLKDIWDTSLNQEILCDEEQEWKQFKKRFHLKKEKKKILVPLSAVLKIAAVFIVSLSIPLTIFISNKKYAQVPETGYFETIVPKGFKSHLKLPDGTKIIINSESKLTYPVKFSKKTREITFEGEAYFEVVKNRKKPFIIHSKGMTTTVLGTKFNLKTYPGEKYTSTLIEGELKFKSDDFEQEIYLCPNERIIYCKDGKHCRIVKNVDTQLYTAWKDNQFMFKNEPFEMLANRLERWYDVTIYLENPELKNFKYTGNFRNEETIWQVLDIIKLTTPINYRTKHREVFITKK